MLEVLKTVAILCSVNTGSIHGEYLRSIQTDCHNVYMKCIESKQASWGTSLAECMITINFSRKENGDYKYDSN